MRELLTSYGCHLNQNDCNLNHKTLTNDSVTSIALSVCACARRGGGVGDCSLDAERSAHLQLGAPGKVGAKPQRTHGERGGTYPAARPKDGNYAPTRGKNPEPAQPLPLPLPSPPPGSLATMRSDFALVLTAALLLDAFWVRFLFSAVSFFFRRRVVGSGRSLLNLQASGEKAE